MVMTCVLSMSMPGLGTTVPRIRGRIWKPVTSKLAFEDVYSGPVY